MKNSINRFVIRAPYFCSNKKEQIYDKFYF